MEHSSYSSEPASQDLRECTPLTRWHDPAFARRDVSVWIKRDDLTDPWTGGNKRRKFLHLLHPDRLAGRKGIYSLGGPFSNHLTALALAAARLGVPSRGFVRSWRPVDNPLIRQWRAWGMDLVFLQPPDFAAAETHTPADLNEWLFIPMGGAHPLSLEGTAAIVREIRIQSRTRITHYAVPAGTGATAAGMAGALDEMETLMVYPALKLPDANAWLQARMAEWGVRTPGNVVVDAAVPRMRLGRPDPELWRWMDETAQATGILFDPIYTAPMARKLQADIGAGNFPPGSAVVLIHTGGHAGRLGYQWRFDLPFLNGTEQSWPSPDTGLR